MGRCSNCGRESRLLKVKRCLFCGKVCCEKCGSFVLRIGYEDKVACSPECKKSYEQQVLDHPVEDADTSLEIRILENELWYNACFAPMYKNDSSLEAWMRLLKNGRAYAKRILNIETTSANGRERTDLRERFSSRVLPLLSKASFVRSSAQPSLPTDTVLSVSKKPNRKKTIVGIIIGVVLVIAIVAGLSAFAPKADLKWDDFDFHDNAGATDKSIHINGTIVNSGSLDATDVRLIIRIYDSVFVTHQEDLLTTETINIGNISAGESYYISRDIQYSHPHHLNYYTVDRELQWRNAG